MAAFGAPRRTLVPRRRSLNSTDSGPLNLGGGNHSSCPETELETGSAVGSREPQPSSSKARLWTGRLNQRMIRSGPVTCGHGCGDWLKSLGLGQYDVVAVYSHAL